MRHIDRLPEPQILSKKKEEWQCKFEQKLARNPKARPDASKYGHEEIHCCPKDFRDLYRIY
jgi:hypothetical protein